MDPGSETYPRLGGSVPPRLCSVPINQCRSRSHCLMDLFFRSSSRADEPETGFAQKIIGGTQKKLVHEFHKEGKHLGVGILRKKIPVGKMGGAALDC